MQANERQERGRCKPASPVQASRVAAGRPSPPDGVAVSRCRVPSARRPSPKLVFRLEIGVHSNYG
jgi:hypothetical protein